MTEQAEAESKLGPDWAFVVQLRSDTRIKENRVCGRIEHLVSGDSAPFTSLEMMLSFMAKHTAGSGSRP